jgi:hypothetical protein
MARYWGKNIVAIGDWVCSSDPRDPRPANDITKVGYDFNAAAKARDFEFKTQCVLSRIAGNPVGKLLIREINGAAAHNVEIRPLALFCMARRTRTLFDSPGDALAAGPDTPRRGSDIKIWYNPDTFQSMTAKMDVDPKNHMQPEDALFHELVHAVRAMRGQINAAPGFGGFENREDFYAIMLTNIYLSTRGRNFDMRGDHRQWWSPLPAAYANNPFNFFDDSRAAIEQLFHEMPTFCNDIAKFTSVWNPLYVRNFSKGISESQGGPNPFPV